MVGISPAVLIKKLISDVSAEGVVRAEVELKKALVAAMPSLAFKGKLCASLNDAEKAPETVEVRTHGEYFFLSYCGTRRADIGAYLLVRIYFPMGLSGGRLLKFHAHDLPFVRSIIVASGQTEGMVTVGQTSADARSLAVTSGKRFDVFAYLLASTAGLDRLYAKPGGEVVRNLWNDLDDFFGDQKERSELVNVSGWAKGRFLRSCFRELSGLLSPRVFDEKFGPSGIFWRPRSPLQWLGPRRRERP